MNSKPAHDLPRSVKVFSTETCHHCVAAKRYMDEHGVEYEDADIIHDLEARREMALMTGQYGVPVIRVGSRAMVGWDPKEFERLMAGGC